MLLPLVDGRDRPWFCCDVDERLWRVSRCSRPGDDVHV